MKLLTGMVYHSNNINKTKKIPLTTIYSTQEKTTVYGVVNPGTGLGQAHKHGRVKPINVMIGSPTAIHV